MRSNLFQQKLQERETKDRFALQSSKLLRAHLDGATELVATAGAMVAYQGNVSFSYKGSGGVGKWLKKQVSGEDARFMKVRGEGEVFFARQAQEIFLLDLEAEDAISVESRSLLAFDASIDYDLELLRRGGSLLGGGLFNARLRGPGLVAVTTDGPPLLLDCGVQPTFVDPQAVVCWSANLKPGFKNDLAFGSLFGRSSGEAFQMAFHGPGFVVVQPSEGAPVVPVAGGEANSGGGGFLGELLS